MSSLYLDKNLAAVWHRLLAGIEALDEELTKLSREGNTHAGEITLRLIIDYGLPGDEQYIIRMEDDWAVLEQIPKDQLVPWPKNLIT